jgi:hypothetical protein
MRTDSSPSLKLFCLRISTDGDPSALARLLGYFQNLNIAPRRVMAEFSSNSHLHVQIDVTGVSEERMTLIAAKVGQVPCVLAAYWHRI